MQKILEEENIYLDVDLKTKDELFSFVAKNLKEKNLISDEELLIAGLYKREQESPTGFENGIAIPHVQSKVVNKPIISVIRTKEKINDYESINPNNQVRLIFVITVPEDVAGEHLKLLSMVSTKLVDGEFVKQLFTSSKLEICEMFNDKKEVNTIALEEAKGKILAVTACATGIAHTYMSAEIIEKKAIEMGYEVKVEKQGANGLEDKLTQSDIEEADCIILAHDVALKGLERFEGLKYIDVKVAKPLHEPEKCINEALNSQKRFTASENDETLNENKSLGSEMMQALMTGISYMIPVIVAGGLLMGIAKLSALAIGGNELVNNLGTYLPLGSQPDATNFIIMLAYLDKIGWTIMQFMYPIFAMYLAYSIAGKNALLPGFLGGVFAQGLHTTIWGFDQMPSGIMAPFINSSTMNTVPSGFIGALILGFAAGYVVKKLNKLKFHKNLNSMKSMLVIPGISVLVIIFLSMFIVEPVFGGFNMWLQKIITENAESQYIYAISIATATAFDLGGPVNKAAGAVAMGFASDGTIAMTARTLSIVIPPLGLGLATILDSILNFNVFSKDEKTVGTTSFILGFLAISEGAIPFMLKNPLIVIPINIIGAILGSITAIYLGAEMWLPLPAVWGWPLVEGNIFAYIIGIIVGISFIAIANIVVRKVMNEK